MTSASRAEQQASVPPAIPKTARRWLLLVHRLPSTPSNLRVRTWRRLQQLGAIAVKQTVYVLPDSPGAREDFEWLKAEIDAAGGEASVFAADTVDAWSDDELVQQFRRSCQKTYGSLARDVEAFAQRLDPRASRRKGRAPAIQRLLAGFRDRLAAIDSVDFFGCGGRDRVITLLDQSDKRLTGAARSVPPAEPGSRISGAYRRRLWVTRPRPGVDRMSSAWLIKRFIDPEARFGFVLDRDAAPRDSVPFDMFGVELSHHGEHCTFETLSATFGIGEATLTRVAGIVHDLDLKDGRFGAPEAPTIGTVIEGLQAAYADDGELLAQGITLFEALYRAFGRSARRGGPRPVARRSAKRQRSSCPSR
ncbi:MAG: chromate resistance protein [Acidobacteria bacterium]|nr:chromate resistance protein [Acidobacteriota bacterium]